MIYFLVVLILLTFTILGDNKYFFIVGAVILLFLSAVRSYTVGTDTETYVNIFKGHESYFREIEPGYALLMEIVRLFSTDFQLFLVVSSCAILIPIFVFIDRNSSNKCLSLLLFVILFNYYFSLSALRQALAASAILMSLDYLTRHKVKEFIGLVFLAASFHTTAIMVLPVAYFFYRFDIKVKTAAILLTLSFVIGWFDLFKVRDAVSILEAYNFGGGLIDLSKYYTYSEYSFGDAVNNINAKIFNMVPNTLVCLVVLWLTKKNLGFFTCLFWFGTILINLFVEIPIAFRVAYYLTFMQIILIPNIFIRFRRPSWLFVPFIVVFVSLFLFETNKKIIFKARNPYRNDVVPYRMF